MRGWLFYKMIQEGGFFHLLDQNAKKMMVLSNFQKFPTFNMCSNQSTKENGSKRQRIYTDNSRHLEEFSM